MKIFPKKTTGVLQPLDRFMNRQLKDLLRRIEDRILLHHLDFLIAPWRNQALLISLAYNQFCAPRFENFRRYSWHQTGLVDARPPHFDTPTHYCLDGFSHSDFCGCGNSGFLKCGYCNNVLCFDHFVIEKHLHL